MWCVSINHLLWNSSSICLAAGLACNLTISLFPPPGCAAVPLKQLAVTFV